MAEKLDWEKANRRDKARKAKPDPPPWPDDDTTPRGGDERQEVSETLKMKYGVILAAYEDLHGFERVAQEAAYRSALIGGTRREQVKQPLVNKLDSVFVYEEMLALKRLDALHEEAKNHTTAESGSLTGKRVKCYGQKATVVENDDSDALLAFDNGQEYLVPIEALRLL